MSWFFSLGAEDDDKPRGSTSSFGFSSNAKIDN